MRIHPWGHLQLALTAVLFASCTHLDTPSTSHSQARVVTYHGKIPTVISQQIINQAVGNDSKVHALVNAVINLGGSSLLLGNHVHLLIDGPESFAEITKAVKNARHNIHVETFIFADDSLGEAFKKLLEAKAKQGVTVRIIYDAVGSFGTDDIFFDQMTRAGIEVMAYRPISIKNTLSWKINNRDHRKLIVVDGRVAFTGGINISGTYNRSSTARPGEQRGLNDAWRDTHVKIQGPVATVFQQYFLETWVRLGGPLQDSADEVYPKVEASGSHLVAAVASYGGRDETNIYDSYLAAIEHAQENIHLTNAYFIPNKEIIAALVKAVRRGVDVKLVVPSFTDSSLVIAAARACYAALLRGGVKIYERKNALLHSKTATFDNTVSIVGSANLDMRSFIHNNELNAVIVSTQFADELNAVFDQDLLESEQITWQRWQERPLTWRVKEFFSRLFSYWL